jgi:hypothetical protein
MGIEKRPSQPGFIPPTDLPGLRSKDPAEWMGFDEFREKFHAGKITAGDMVIVRFNPEFIQKYDNAWRGYRSEEMRGSEGIHVQELYYGSVTESRYATGRTRAEISQIRKSQAQNAIEVGFEMLWHLRNLP